MSLSRARILVRGARRREREALAALRGVQPAGHGDGRAWLVATARAEELERLAARAWILAIVSVLA